MTPKYIKINDIIKNLNKKGIVDKSKSVKTTKHKPKHKYTISYIHTTIQTDRQTNQRSKGIPKWPIN